MNLFEAKAQGARCGYIEGKGRAGSYCIGEEEELSLEAAVVNVRMRECAYGAPRERLRALWAMGYRIGYRLAASGEELSPEYGEG